MAAVKIGRTAIASMFYMLGYRTAPKWDKKRFEDNIAKLSTTGTLDQVPEGAAPEDVKTFRDVLTALGKGDTIELFDDRKQDAEADKPAEAPADAPVAAPAGDATPNPEPAAEAATTKPRTRRGKDADPAPMTDEAATVAGDAEGPKPTAKKSAKKTAKKTAAPKAAKKAATKTAKTAPAKKAPAKGTKKATTKATKKAAPKKAAKAAAPKAAKSKTAKTAPAKKAATKKPHDPNKDGQGVRLGWTRPYVAGLLMAKYVEANGGEPPTRVEPAMIQELNKLYGKKNDMMSRWYLTEATHFAHAFTGKGPKTAKEFADQKAAAKDA